MKERFKMPCAVFLILERKNEGRIEILMQYRNQGVLADCWDVSASGHVEEDETLTEAVIREAEEEINVKIEEKDLEFVYLNHSRYLGDPLNLNKRDANHPILKYICVYFKAKKFTGKPLIQEPEKCGKLEWVEVNNLPKRTLGDRREILKKLSKNVNFGQFGWEEKNV